MQFETWGSASPVADAVALFSERLKEGISEAGPPGAQCCWCCWCWWFSATSESGLSGSGRLLECIFLMMHC